MTTTILAYIACAFNVAGMILYMCGPSSLIDTYRQMTLKKKIACYLAVIITTALVIITKLYLILFLAAEYILILCLCRSDRDKYKGADYRGIISIILQLLVEIAIALVIYLKSTQELSNEKMQVISYLGMATIQYCLVVFDELRKIGRGFKKMLLIALEVKAVENIIWLMICIRGGLFQYDFISLTLWFFFTMTMCYMLLFVVLYKIEEREIMEKRADIHVNSYEYYMHMEEEHLQIRKLYHEMKNQLMILENDDNIVNGTNSGEQVRKFGEKLEELQRFYHTGIASLDILLFDGKMKAESKGIEFEAVVSEGCLSFMREEDVNVIFSNTIINAIEACEKIKQGPKYIKIKAGENLNDTLIYIKNTVDSVHPKGTLRTGKKNKKLHGIGMTSIQECVERYNGYVSIIEEDDTFQLAILFGGGEKIIV